MRQYIYLYTQMSTTQQINMKFHHLQQNGGCKTDLSERNRI